MADFSRVLRDSEILGLKKDRFGATPKPTSETDVLPRTNQTERFRITSYLQLRELDLLGRHRRRCIVQLSFFFLRRSFFARRSCSGIRRGERRAADTAAPTTRMRWTGQIFWLLAYDACAAPHLLPAFTPEFFRELAQWEVVSSYSSATAPDSHGISCADPLFQARKELESRTSDLRSASQDLSNQPTNPTLWPRLILLLA